MGMSNVRAMVVASGLAIGLGTSVSLGQYALGDGRALDANTQVGGTGINEPTRDYLAEFRFRNAIVTGNAPGGMSFRDEVGYGLSSEFRQRVGSDDLFSFRRDSFMSGLAGAGIRGTEALQYQFALTVGSAPPRNLRGSLLTSRTGGVASSVSSMAMFDGGDFDTGLRSATPEELGEIGPGMALSLRSTSAFTAGRSLNPSMLQMAADDRGATFGVIASPLRGLAMDELLGDVEARRDEAASSLTGLREPGEAGPTGLPAGIAPLPSAVETELHGRLSEGLASRTGGLEGADPSGSDAAGPKVPLRAQLDELRRVLNEGMSVAGEAGQGVGPGGAALPMEGWKPLVETLKSSAGTIRVPSARMDRASAYDMHLSRAREMLGQGRYFEAEQRFTMALAARPGDAVAMIGRVHAQIGAGLDLSASLNLRAFLLEHPEYVGARYEADMLPGRERLDVTRRRLLEQLGQEDVRVATRESALLLAYVSFLLDERVSLIVGLERLDEGEAARRDALVPLLRAVWLDEDSAPAGATQEGEGEREGR